MTLTLRPYQEEALAAIEGAPKRGVSKPLVVLPTGSGKTLVFSKAIERCEPPVLVLAHRDELLKQAAEKLTMVAPHLAMSIGFVRGRQNDVRSPIVIGSVQTLAQPRRLAQLPSDFNLAVVDEAHHATSPSYRRIFDHVDAPVFPGFTATPERNDGAHLGDVFDEIVYAKSLLEMIEEGYLSNLRGLRVELKDLDLTAVRATRSGEYQVEDLAQALQNAHAPEHTAAALLEHAADRKSIVFVPTVELAYATARAIDAAGIPAAAVDGQMPDDRRRRVLSDLTAGRIRALVNVDVCSEGYDEPSIDCIAIAAPTRSRIAYVQRVGRGTRLHPGKEDCLVLDMVGVTDDLKLQSLPRLFQLRRPPRAGESVTDAVRRERDEREEEGREAGIVEVDPESRSTRGVELFNRERMHWLTVGDRWVMSAGDNELLALDPAEGRWRVLLIRQSGAKVLARGLDLGYAQGAAEETIRSRGTIPLADKAAPWRRRPPKPGQLGYLQKLGVRTEPTTRGEATDLITQAVARRQLSRLDRALERQEAAA